MEFIGELAEELAKVASEQAKISATQAYFAGVRKGLWMFAWWKDGVQCVGTSGATLKNALEEVDELEREELKRLQR